VAAKAMQHSGAISCEQFKINRSIELEVLMAQNQQSRLPRVHRTARDEGTEAATNHNCGN
jgi:hypothetical protein